MRISSLHCFIHNRPIFFTVTFVNGQQEIGLYAIGHIPEQTELFFDYYKHGDGSKATSRMKKQVGDQSKKT